MERSVKNLQTDFIKFHGCGAYRRDGTNVLCTKRNPCSIPINACFWMKNRDAIPRVRTRNSELNDAVLRSTSLKTQYFNNIHRRKQIQYYSTDESESQYTDSDSDSDSVHSNYPNPDNNLIIDIEKDINDINHLKNSISETIDKKLNEVQEAVNLYKQTNANQNQNLSLQSPNDKNKSMPLTV